MPLESIVTANRFQGPVCSMKHQTNDQNEFTKLNKRMFLKKLELKIKILLHTVSGIIEKYLVIETLVLKVLEKL